MRKLFAGMAVVVVTCGVAGAFEPSVQDVINRHKAGKRLDAADVAELMRQSAQWCYDNQDHSCAWTDIYLDVTDERATFELSHAWDEATDIAYTNEGVFRDDRYICETGFDWVPSVRATRRDGNGVVTGRDLWALKTEIGANRNQDALDCYDYLYLRSDPDQQVVTLLQRQYQDDVHVEANDVEVTLHMNSEDAAGLTLRW